MRTRPLASAPTIGPWLPTATVHVMFFAVATAVCLMVLPGPLWRTLGLLLAATVTIMPDRVPAWWLLLMLAASQLWREPSATDVVFYLLVAGVHLLHMLAGVARLLPWSGRIQAAALLRPLRRYGLIQSAVQAVAFGALATFEKGPGTVSGLSILAAGAIAVIAVVLARRLRQTQLPA